MSEAYQNIDHHEIVAVLCRGGIPPEEIRAAMRAAMRDSWAAENYYLDDISEICEAGIEEFEANQDEK